HVAMPLPTSAQVKWAVTGELFQPLAFGAGVRLTPIDGLVWSMLMLDRVTEPTLPAMSVAWPVADWLAPSAVNMMGGVRLPGRTPDSESEAVNVTITGLLFQPPAFAAGDCVAVTAGAVLSMFTTTVAAAVWPA